MRPRDRPTTRAGPMDDHLDEAFVIDMSMDGQEKIQEAPARSMRTPKRQRGATWRRTHT